MAAGAGVSGVLCASANFVLFCARIIQLNIFHGRYGLHSRDWQSSVAGVLILFAILGSAFGRGRVPFSIFLAAVLGFGLGVSTAIAIL